MIDETTLILIGSLAMNLLQGAKIVSDIFRQNRDGESTIDLKYRASLQDYVQTLQDQHAESLAEQYERLREHSAENDALRARLAAYEAAYGPIGPSDSPAKRTGT